MEIHPGHPAGEDGQGHEQADKDGTHGRIIAHSRYGRHALNLTPFLQEDARRCDRTEAGSGNGVALSISLPTDQAAGMRCSARSLLRCRSLTRNSRFNHLALPA